MRKHVFVSLWWKLSFPPTPKPWEKGLKHRISQKANSFQPWFHKHSLKNICSFNWMGVLVGIRRDCLSEQFSAVVFQVWKQFSLEACGNCLGGGGTFPQTIFPLCVCAHAKVYPLLKQRITFYRTSLGSHIALSLSLPSAKLPCSTLPWLITPNIRWHFTVAKARTILYYFTACQCNHSFHVCWKQQAWKGINAALWNGWLIFNLLEMVSSHIGSILMQVETMKWTRAICNDLNYEPGLVNQIPNLASEAVCQPRLDFGFLWCTNADVLA